MRDQSKLLVEQSGHMKEDLFRNLADHLPAKPVIYLNDTRVIHARLHFLRKTGALIEIFCLEPLSPEKEVQLALQAKGSATWKCLIGNSRRWKDEELEIEVDHNGQHLVLKADRIKTGQDHSEVAFQWTPSSITFSEVLDILGKTPLPPYLEREVEPSDNQRYQTVYATREGSVAAPTAGLHFTDRVFSDLKSRGADIVHLTLHVGAGTFRPVSTDHIDEHRMHEEEIHFSKSSLYKLLNEAGRPRVVIGTTSTRLLESIYWQGVKWLLAEPESPVVDIQQWDPYGPLRERDIPLDNSILRVLQVMDRFSIDELSGKTSLMIVPGYSFKVPDILVTNFHLPKSTLLLLIAAFVGDRWKSAYRYALDHDFRFLSYGDSCLFHRRTETI